MNFTQTFFGIEKLERDLIINETEKNLLKLRLIHNYLKKSANDSEQISKFLSFISSLGISENRKLPAAKELKEEIRKNSSWSLQQALDYAVQDRILTAQCIGNVIADFIIMKYGMEPLKKSDKCGDAKTKNGINLEIRISISDKPAISQIRPFHKDIHKYIIVSYLRESKKISLFLIDSKDMNEKILKEFGNTAVNIKEYEGKTKEDLIGEPGIEFQFSMNMISKNKATKFLFENNLAEEKCLEQI